MFFFARPPSCAGFTRLLTFRVTRKSQPPQRPKISHRLAADIIRSDHPTRPDTSFQFLRPFTWHNPSGITLLRTLRRYEKRQLLCNQANPNSFCKRPGWGGTSVTVPRALANPFACHTCRIDARKSFPCHTYEGGWGPIMVNCGRPATYAAL